MALGSGKKDKKSKMYLLLAIGLLFVINAGLIYQLVTKNSKLKVSTTELQSTEAELEHVEELKLELETELDKYKGQNASLDSIITVRDAEIITKVNRLQKLLRSGNVTASQLKEAKAEITSLQSQVTELTAEIEELSKENQYLKDENYVMQKKVESEQEKVAEMEEVITEKNKQVAVGSRLFLKSLTAAPLRTAIVGEFKPTDKLGRMDNLSVAYTLGNNDLTGKGEKTLYFQIVKPSKGVLVSGNAGGTLNFDDGERLYTLKKVVNFQNKNESGSFSIPKTEGMTEGKYMVNVFSENHKMGSTEFSLR